MAQALGFPVVPEVKIRQLRSAGPEGVAGEIIEGRGREAWVRRVVFDSGDGGGRVGNA